jgi:hypothetical protein
MGRKKRFKCANCGSKRNVRFYKNLALNLCDRCGSFKLRVMEAAENDEYEDLMNWEEDNGIVGRNVKTS